MTPELTYLVWAVILLLVHILVQAAFSDLSRGLHWGFGPRDETPDQSVIGARVQRALHNYLETLPAFAILALIIAQLDASTSTTVLGAAVYFWARVLFVPVYALGIPVVRSVVWFVSMAGLLLMLLGLL